MDQQETIKIVSGIEHPLGSDLLISVMCEMLSRKNEALYSGAVKYIGSILVSEDKRIAEAVMKNNPLDKLTSIMFSTNSTHLKESLWLLSNLAASGEGPSKIIIKNSVVQRVLTLASSYNIDV